MLRLDHQMSDERPNPVLVTDMYVDVNENVQLETFTEHESGMTKQRYVYDVKRYSHEEYIKIQAEETAELRGAVLELSDIVLSGGMN